MEEQRSSQKILLVDDNPKNLQIAMSILKEFNVIFAQSGEKALSLLESNDFDLILLDVVMPILDGYEVCKKIKSNKKTNDIPIIFLTVKDDEKDIVKGFEYGAVDFITKPFYSEVLLKRVQLHLSLSRALGELKDVNKNLNTLVDKQVDIIRKKDELIYQQSKIAAMSDIIDIVSIKWKQPLNMIKLYLQSMNIKIEENSLKEDLDRVFQEVNKLDNTMEDFQRFFKNDLEKQSVNVKVIIENVLFLLKDEILKNRVNTRINGDHLLELYIVSDELKHIILKLITHSLENISNKSSSSSCIDFFIEENRNEKLIRYIDNTSTISEVHNILNFDNSTKNDEFDLSSYLLNIFIEKNQGKLIFNECSKGIDLSIRFNK